MKLVMTLLVRDEEDILQENIEYHLSQGVNHIIATDNRSVDTTKEILKYYESLGVLHYIYENSDDYSQHKWVTRMARLAYTKHAADWVINCDADEFWWPLYRDNLHSAFNDAPSNLNIITAQRYNFVCVKNAKRKYFYRDMIYRETASKNPIGRPLSPKVAHVGGSSVIVDQGNHSVQGIGPHITSDDIVEILHFPIRSESQIINKILLGGAAYERNTDLPSNIGKTWRDLYHRYKADGDLSNYITKSVYDDNKISAGLDNGTILLDTRLRDYIDQK